MLLDRRLPQPVQWKQQKYGAVSATIDWKHFQHTFHRTKLTRDSFLSRFNSWGIFFVTIFPQISNENARKMLRKCWKIKKYASHSPWCFAFASFWRVTAHSLRVFNAITKQWRRVASHKRHLLARQRWTIPFFSFRSDANVENGQRFWFFNFYDKLISWKFTCWKLYSFRFGANGTVLCGSHCYTQPWTMTAALA